MFSALVNEKPCALTSELGPTMLSYVFLALMGLAQSLQSFVHLWIQQRQQQAAVLINTQGPCLWRTHQLAKLNRVRRRQEDVDDE